MQRKIKHKSRFRWYAIHIYHLVINLVSSELMVQNLSKCLVKSYIWMLYFILFYPVTDTVFGELKSLTLTIFPAFFTCFDRLWRFLCVFYTLLNVLIRLRTINNPKLSFIFIWVLILIQIKIHRTILFNIIYLFYFKKIFLNKILFRCVLFSYRRVTITTISWSIDLYPPVIYRLSHQSMKWEQSKNCLYPKLPLLPTIIHSKKQKFLVTDHRVFGSNSFLFALLLIKGILIK